MASVASWRSLRVDTLRSPSAASNVKVPRIGQSQRSVPLHARCLLGATCAALVKTRRSRARRRGRRWAAADMQVYDAAQVEALALQNPAAIFWRGVQVVSRLGRYYLSLKLDDALGRDKEAVTQRSRELRELLLELGPVYVKLGQALANRPDIVRDDYMAELEMLQDKVPPFPSPEAMSIIRSELGQDPKDIFSELSAEPVAAASLGQVYRGRLRSNGEEVAVKVQRPGLKDGLVLDMYIFRRNLGCNVTLVVDEFGTKLWEEANYVNEAENAQKFAANFREDPSVKIPEVFMRYVRRKVITMQWIDGLKSTDLAGMRRQGIDVDEFIRNGVQAALRQLLEFGLFHGDPHAGNIFAMRDGRIAYVDFGNVANISASQRDVLIGAITHVSNSDYQEIANDFIRLGFLRPGTDVSEIVPAMETIWADSMGKSIKDFNFRTVTARFSKLVYQFPIRIPERFSLVIRSLLMQEGICMCLNPEFSIIEVALPYASKRLLSNPNSRLRRELLSIVFRAEGEDQRPVLQWDRLTNLVMLAKQARDGTSIQINQVIVDFFRGLRRDVINGVDTGLAPAKVLRGGLEALTAGNRLRLRDVLQLVELLSPDLTPALAREVADALIRDTVEDVLKERGVELELEDFDPKNLGKVLGSPKELLKLLPVPPVPRPV
ncbi:unnamed protein product [Effrenium voratum]|nr:unnamed protein product [Effrenium voratum]